ncbi:hypothetical protein GCM10008024_19790 [Allgaiera indica]|uniref:Uncharacterized protein n=1 Tax=Allgaiera indica TaxID=765699 RepID=A0AAN4ZZV0_9RHOB|nr:hypothetical protein GCM10008024_19790 [Allgaiera indica]
MNSGADFRRMGNGLFPKATECGTRRPTALLQCLGAFACKSLGAWETIGALARIVSPVETICKRPPESTLAASRQVRGSGAKHRAAQPGKACPRLTAQPGQRQG